MNEIINVVCISDTHGKHRELDMPEGDILIHTGDFTKFGKLQDATDFNDWLGELNYDKIFVSSGNHEQTIFAKERLGLKQLFTNATYLENQTIEIDTPQNNKIKLHAIQFLPNLLPSCDSHPLYDLTPSRLDILMSHAPPLNYLDDGHGCPGLLNCVKRIKPQLHVFGHIHQGSGILKGNQEDDLEHTTFINAAICYSDRYSVKFEPRIFQLQI